MEIGDISKVATRKRINTDVEKLKEKVSRETAKIIKLKVSNLVTSYFHYIQLELR